MRFVVVTYIVVAATYYNAQTQVHIAAIDFLAVRASQLAPNKPIYSLPNYIHTSILDFLGIDSGPDDPR